MKSSDIIAEFAKLAIESGNKNEKENEIIGEAGYFLTGHCHLVYLFRCEGCHSFGTDSPPFTDLEKHFNKSIIRG
ncbi:MAG: hypothetical protein WCK53_12335 [Methanomicrobiales archaeon]